jgi:D-3-phosphoglycerate dehydrogenase / 2-oxoglutarate reductase
MSTTMTQDAATQRVLVVGRVHPSGMQVLRERAGLRIEQIDDPGVVLPADALTGVDAVLIRYGVLTERHLAHAARLRVVSRHGVGCDNLPVEALSARGIPVTVVGGVNSVSVAEQAMAMMLALAKRVVSYDRAVRGGAWAIRDSLAASELAGRTLLLLGFGRIGRELARRAQAFDMDVWVHDPAVSAEAAAHAGVRWVEDWRALLGQVDVLSLHLPLTPATRGLIGESELAAMKPTAVVLNTARGGLLDEAALHRALSGRMAAGGAGIDTFEQEPPPDKQPLLALPNVVLSPHSASLTQEAAERMGVVAARNVLAGLDGCIDPALLFSRAALGR